MADESIFHAVFLAIPSPCLLLKADVPFFTIAAVNNAYLQATHKKEEDLVGKSLFHAFPGSPAQTHAETMANVRFSLETVLQTKQPHQAKKQQRYDLAATDNKKAEERYWNPENIPLLNEEGKVAFILHTVKDVTDEVLAMLQAQIAEAKIEQSKNLLQHAEVISNFGTWEYDLVTNELYWSQGVYRICGYEPETFDLTYSNAMSVIHPDDREKASLMMQQTILENKEYKMLKRFVTADGSIRHIHSRAHLIHNAEQQPLKLVGVFRDITEEVLAQQQVAASESKFQALVQTLDGIFWEADAQTFLFSYVSPQVKNILGYSVEEWMSSDTFWQEHIYAEDRDFAINYCHMETVAGKDHVFEYRMVTANGSLVWLRDIVSLVKHEGKPVTLRGLMIDITDSKQTANELKQSKEEMQHLIFNTDEAFLLLNKALNIVSFNEQFAKLYKQLLGADVKKGDYIINYAQPERRELVKGIYKNVLDGKEEQSVITIPLPGGGRKIFLIRFKPAFNKAQEGIGAFITARDVTEAELAKEELEQSAEQYKYLFENNPAPMFIWDFETKNIIDCNEASLLLYGYTKDEFLQLSILDIRPQADKEKIEKVAESEEAYLNQSKRMHVDVWRHLKKSGEIMEVRVDAHLLTYKGRRSSLVIIHDVTAQRSEEAQRRLLETVISKTNDAIIVTKAEPLDYPQGPEIIYVNEAFTEMTGYTKDEVIGKTPRILQGPGSNREVLRQLGKSLKKWQHCDVDLLNYTKDGREFWVNLSIAPIADENGWFTHWVSVQKDITERKQEELKKKLLADISSLFNQNKPLAVVLPEVLELIAVAEKFSMCEAWIIGQDKQAVHLQSKYFEQEKKELFYTTDPVKLKFSKGEGLPGIVWDTKNLCVWNGDENDERFIRRDEALKAGLHKVAGVPLIIKDEIIGVLVAGMGLENSMHEEKLALLDAVAAHLAAEIKRKQLEENLNMLFENSPDILTIIGPSGKFIKVNPAFCKLIGYTEEELTSRPFSDFIHPDDRYKTATEYTDAITGVKRAHEFLNRYIAKTGKYCWISWNSSDLFGEEGLAFAYGRDITATKELQSLLDTATEIAHIGGWELNVEENIQHWTPMTRAILEVDEDYVADIEKGFTFYRADVRPEVEAIVMKAMQTGEPFDFEMPVITAKGNEKWVRTIGHAEFRDQKCVRLYGSFQDIDQRKKAELELQKLFEERNDVLESIGDAFFAIDGNWVVTYWNKEAELILERKREEIVGKRLFDVYADAVNLPSFDYYNRAMATGEIVSFEDYYTKLNKWFDIVVYPSSNGLSVYFKDISIRKTAEEQIKRSNERFEKVTEATNDAIWDFDTKSNELFWSKGFDKLFGYNTEQVVPTLDLLLSLIHESDRMRVAAKIQEYMQTPRLTNWFEEYQFKKADGSYAFVIDRAVFVRNNEGEVVRVVGAMTDISYRKEYEESLSKLNEILQQQSKELAISNRELEQFAYIASHDLQEPLRMITSFLTQIDKKYHHIIDEKGKQYIHFAVDGARRMRQIILDLLEFSRVGRTAFQPEEVNLNELLHEIQLLFSRQISEKNAILTVAKMPNLRGHRSPLRQIFQNIIGNALKYSRPGVAPEIEVLVEEQEQYWQFAITDNGIGVEEEYFEKIFIIFQRLHSKDEYAGTGMGLAISKKIVENLGGRIWLQSKPGVGSTFYFTLAK